MPDEPRQPTLEEQLERLTAQIVDLKVAVQAAEECIGALLPDYVMSWQRPYLVKWEQAKKAVR